jgi:hypothetical protein
MALDILFDVIFDNMQDRKEIREKAEEVNNRRAYGTRNEASGLILNRLYTLLRYVHCWIMNWRTMKEVTVTRF